MPSKKTQRALIAEIVRRMETAYGIPEWRPHHDPTSELVLTILSQNTSDSNSGRAFGRLLEQFSSWEAVMSAPLPELTAAIQPGGLAPTKAPRIQAALRDIMNRTGGFDLRFLEAMPPEEARAWLGSLHGVGPKTVACVLMFALGVPAMPVDTHVFRVSMRLGLIPERSAVGGRRSAAGETSAAASTRTKRKGSGAREEPRTAAMTAEKAHALLEAIVPAEEYYAFHIGLIKHGRRVCAAQRPACPDCVLLDLCPSPGMFHPELKRSSRRKRRIPRKGSIAHNSAHDER
jgi:endonuclease-3